VAGEAPDSNRPDSRVESGGSGRRGCGGRIGPCSFCGGLSPLFLERIRINVSVREAQAQSGSSRECTVRA
jgi:hypothetical protein